jgi:ParB-like chromosome segregation protein Spo0J
MKKDKKKQIKRLNLPETAINSGFDHTTVDLQIDQIAQVKMVPPTTLRSVKYKQIIASIREVGIIETPVVTLDSKSRKYILLDGHLRLAALKELDETEVTCLVSTDDEGFTYNKHINRLSTIQEHKMILRAVERGVAEEKIAKALNVDVGSIVRKRNLLEGICKEAVELLKDKMVAGGVFPILKRMQPMRQIEAATLMNDSDTYTQSFAHALLAATPQRQLSNPEKPKKVKGLDEEQMARMESEMESLQREYQLIEENFNKDVMNLTLSRGYLGALLGNARVVRYMAQNHKDILMEFQKITEMTSLKDAAA